MRTLTRNRSDARPSGFHAPADGFSGATPLSPIERSKTTADEVESRLILAIARGDKRAGERITEAELANALKVSRVPAREAMQKLVLRGILVGGPQRGLRVADYSEKRIAELFELRLAIETLLLEHVMRVAERRTALIADLSPIMARMRLLSGSGDPILLSTVDLDFHRALALHSGNVLAAQIWEGLAQHMFIVFCRHWSSAADRTGEVHLHEMLVDFIGSGSVEDIAEMLSKHFDDPSTRTPRTLLPADGSHSTNGA